MVHHKGKYEKKSLPQKWKLPWYAVFAAFFMIELFSYEYLGGEGTLVFGLLWSVILTGILMFLPEKAGRFLFMALYGAMIVYAAGQTGYFQLFSEMMWISDFRYAAEGSDYLDVLLSYPLGWFLWISLLLVAGFFLVWKFPVFPKGAVFRTGVAVMMAFAVVGTVQLPRRSFYGDKGIQYARSDYGRMQSAEAAYENMFSAHRLYQICGIYQTAAKDIFVNVIYPLSPAYAMQQQEGKEEVETFCQEEQPQEALKNHMTGILKDKDVILVLMESMDDWMIGTHTPTISRLMEEGIQFTNFYTPPYGGIRTFNTEFCINTGSYLSSKGGYAFDYVTNSYDHSLASLLTNQGYSAKTFHYNDPTFYSRGVYSSAMGYEEYVCYADYLTEYPDAEKKKLLYDDLLVLQNEELRKVFFRGNGKTLNFLITRSAHLSYKYNEVLSHWGLKKYPEYRNMTGNEETDCALLKARLVDDLFAELLTALEQEGRLENTVIIGVTDHYTYGYKDMESLLKLSGVHSELLLEKTPCFIWSPGLKPQKVDKVLNTADFLPTVLNLLGVETDHEYIGCDAFDQEYDGFVPFSNGSWICRDGAFDAETGTYLCDDGKPGEISATIRQEMDARTEDFIRINNLILETDYYE